MPRLSKVLTKKVTNVTIVSHKTKKGEKMKFTITLDVDKDNYELLKEYGYHFKRNLEDLIEIHGNELRRAVQNGKSNKTIKENRK